MFKETKRLAPIEQSELLGAVAPFAQAAFVDARRPLYLPIVESDLAEFLERTKIDRYVWREAQPEGDTAEMVCTSFSVLMWGLLEQERLKQGMRYPLAVARVSLDEPRGGHSLCGFWSATGVFKLIEPQTDAIYLPRKDQSLQIVMFQ